MLIEVFKMGYDLAPFEAFLRPLIFRRHLSTYTLCQSNDGSAAAESACVAQRGG